MSIFIILKKHTKPTGILILSHLRKSPCYIYWETTVFDFCKYTETTNFETMPLYRTKFPSPKCSHKF